MKQLTKGERAELAELKPKSLFQSPAWVLFMNQNLRLSDNLQYDMLGCWVDHLIDQVQIKNKIVGCQLGLAALKTLYFDFLKLKNI